jgi:peptidoglycan/xylan/chitin deacetylase (PgdA/CDA1 family)
MKEDNAADRVGEGRLWPERNAYAPDREPAPWPDGKSLAVYVAVGIEDYVVGRGVTEDILPGVPAPDLLNASWRAYGLRVGGPRLLDRLHQLGVPITVLLNTAVYDSAGPLIEQARRLGAELVAHGEFNSDSLDGMSRSEEKAYLQKVAERIRREEGQPPLGWSSPWLTHTPHTLDLLTECGYRYLLGLRFDDQPVWLQTGHGPLLTIPYSVEINDSSAMIGRDVSAKEFADRIVDEFSEQLAASSDTPLVMSIILHSFISGVPFRLHHVARAIERVVEQKEVVWFARPCDIYEHLSGRAP